PRLLQAVLFVGAPRSACAPRSRPKRPLLGLRVPRALHAPAPNAPCWGSAFRVRSTLPPQTPLVGAPPSACAPRSRPKPRGGAHAAAPPHPHQLSSLLLYCDPSAPSSVEAVADSTHRLEIARLTRIDFELRAQLLHEIVDRARRAVVVLAPDPLEDGL